MLRIWTRRTGVLAFSICIFLLLFSKIKIKCRHLTFFYARAKLSRTNPSTYHHFILLLQKKRRHISRAIEAIDTDVIFDRNSSRWSPIKWVSIPFVTRKTHRREPIRPKHRCRHRVRPRRGPSRQTRVRMFRTIYGWKWREIDSREEELRSWKKQRHHPTAWQRKQRRTVEFRRIPSGCGPGRSGSMERRSL